MSPTRREALAQLSVLLAAPLVRWPDMMADPLSGTIAAFQAGRLRGDFTAVEITRRALDRCRTWNATLRAVDQLAAGALDEARASDRRARAGTLLGPLDGVPLFAKSIYDMRGLPTTASSAAWAQLFPSAVQRDALEVARLRAAGAVMLGKTVADDFAYRGNGTSSLSGQVHNPHDASGLRTPGGSSAGSAVAVACGMAFAALGTDDGGSNRIPAQFSGVVGMKPTFGLVPRTGVIPTWPLLDTHGPLARSVADAALMLDAIAGPDASDGLALTEAYTRGALTDLDTDALEGARLGIVEAHVPRSQMTAAAVAVFDRAIADCVAAGAVVETFEPPVTRATVREQFAQRAVARGDVVPGANAPAPTANALLRYFLHQRAGGSSGSGSSGSGSSGSGSSDDARTTRTATDRDVERIARRAAESDVQRGLAAYQAFYDVLPKEWTAMTALVQQPYERDQIGQSFARSRAEVNAALTRAFRDQRIDVMVYPTMPFAAPLARDPWPDVRTALGYGNWLGLPEVSVPAGYAADGMPIGNLSFVGLPGTDRRVLALAHSYEHHSRRFVAPPEPS